MTLQAAQIDEDQSHAGIDLYESFGFVFSSRDWTVNLVIGFACFFIGQTFSIAGLVVVLIYWGYAFQVVESRILYPGSIYPTFEFKRAGEYLHRGIWPFLATLPFWLAWSAQFVFWELMLIFPMIFLAAPARPTKRAYISLGIPLTIFLLILGTGVVMIFLIPMTLRSGLMRNFREAFRILWIAGFIRRTWAEMGVTFLFIFAVSWMLAILGAALGCVGLFVAQAWCLLALMHLSWQLYEVYLRKGGTPIDVYEPPTDVFSTYSAENPLEQPGEIVVAGQPIHSPGHFPQNRPVENDAPGIEHSAGEMGDKGPDKPIEHPTENRPDDLPE